jgi:hypothetical protein
MCVSTGNKYLDIGLSIAIGAATGGLATPALSVGLGASTVGAFSATTAFGMSSAMLGAVGGAVMGLGTGVLGAVLMPEQPTYNSEDYDYSPIAYNSQENQVTGSGGTQAAAVLSSEIKKAKSKRAKQAQPKQDSYVNTESFANSGLQIA